jgi:hypothetical protein
MPPNPLDYTIQDPDAMRFALMQDSGYRKGGAVRMADGGILDGHPVFQTAQTPFAEYRHSIGMSRGGEHFEGGGQVTGYGSDVPQLDAQGNVIRTQPTAEQRLLDRGIAPEGMSDSQYAQAQIDRGNANPGHLANALMRILSIPEHLTGSSMGLDPMMGLIGKTGELHSIPKAGQYAASRVAPFAKDTAQMAAELYERGQMPGMVKPTSELTAWHGTPHEIKGNFDLAKVGTGEGAQAYGHGMYFAENPAVAQQYQKDISRSQLMKGGDPLALDQTIGGKPLVAFYESLQAKADRMPIQKAQIEYEKLSFLEDLMQGTQFKDAIARVDDPAVAKWAQSLENSYKPAGNLYKVDIPDEQMPMMLDWDKPLNQQSDIVKKGLKSLGITVDEKAYKAHLDDLEASLLGKESKGIKEVPNPSGESIYKKIVNKFGSPELASQELNKLGITGIRYLDEKSRGRDLEWVIKSPKGGENTFRTKETAEAFLKKNPDYTMIEPKPLTSNFVSFKPETVKILEKNDIPIERKKGGVAFANSLDAMRHELTKAK